MTQSGTSPAASVDRNRVRETIIGWAKNASVEMTAKDLKHVEGLKPLLPAGAQVYISFLPGQEWPETLAAAVALRNAGFQPVPHLPARTVENAAEVERLLGDWTSKAGVNRVLVIAGERPHPNGTYTSSSQLIESGLLGKYGIRHISMAGHPETHPNLSDEELRKWELAKSAAAAKAGVEATFVTQFFYEADPFVEWVAKMRANGIQNPAKAGLAGPCKLTTLLKFAAICGVGASLKQLATRGGALTRLMGESGPEEAVFNLAHAQLNGKVNIAGIHLFPFGGLIRTSTWVHTVAQGRFDLEDDTFTLHKA